jgi:tetratricopeptide (TPR) repeat protein
MRIFIKNRSSMRRQPVAASAMTLLLAACLIAWPAAASEEPADQQGSTQAATADVSAAAEALPNDPVGTDDSTASDSPPAAEDPVTPATTAVATPGMQSIEGVLVEEDSDLLAMESQINTGEYDLPEAWLNARIARIERNSHRFNPELVRPLTLLGDIEAGRGNYNEALDRYNHAVHIQRVSSGLVSPAQVEIVHREADVYRNLGDLKNANEREEYAYHVLRRAYAAYDENLLPGVYRLAEWYQSTNNIYAARALYQRTVDILTANGRGDTPEAIPALEGLAMTYKLERFPPYLLTGSSSSATFVGASQFDAPLHIGDFPRGEQALQKIVQIHRSHGDDPLTVAESVLNLADWFLLFDRSKRANPLYEFAYDLLEDADGIDVVSYFAEPRMLHFPAPNDPRAPTLGSSEEPVRGFVELRHTITSTGFVRSLKTEASQPEGMMDFRVRKSLRASRFRPAIVDGVPVKRTDQIFRHDFTYYPAANRAEQASTGTESVQ